MDMLRNISWDALQAFAEFAESGNFTHAAARLHLSQPALHAKITNLSRLLNSTLYIRKGRGIEITKAGQKVQRFARELQQAAEEFDADLRDTPKTSPVTLIAGEGAYLYMLGAGIRSYRRTTKHALTLQVADAQSALAAVELGQAHIGIAPLDAAPSGVISQTFSRVGQVVALPAKHELASKRSIKLKQLNDCNLVVPPVGRPHRTMLSRLLQSESVTWHVAVEVSGWELMLNFVQLGVGLAIVNECCRLPKGVVSRPIPELPSIYYSLFHMDKRLSKPVADLKQTLLSSCDSWRSNN